VCWDGSGGWKRGGLCKSGRLTVRKVPNGMGVGGTEREVV
jgi:hypothetical protein